MEDLILKVSTRIEYNNEPTGLGNHITDSVYLQKQTKKTTNANCLNKCTIR